VNFFRTIVALSCSFAGYRTILDRPWPVTAWYLSRLIALLALVLTLALVPRFLALTDDWAAWTDQHAPAFALRDGRVVTDLPQPVTAGTAQFRLLLDTTGATATPDTNAAFGLLFHSDSVLFWLTTTNPPAPTIQSQRHSLRGFPDGPVNGTYVRQLLRSFLPVGVPLLWVGLTVAGLAVVLLQTAFFTMLGSLLERAGPAALPVRQLANLVAHAVTPAAILVTVYAALPLRNVDFWLIYLVAYSVFLIGATHACRAPVPR
jgi:hypothetical protein